MDLGSLQKSIKENLASIVLMRWESAINAEGVDIITISISLASAKSIS
jgi:hypothetical protein